MVLLHLRKMLSHLQLIKTAAPLIQHLITTFKGLRDNECRIMTRFRGSTRSKVPHEGGNQVNCQFIDNKVGIIWQIENSLVTSSAKDQTVKDPIV